jgi:hypothetical protein
MRPAISPPGSPPRQRSCHEFCFLPSYPHPPRQQSCHGGCFPRAPHLSRAVLRPRCARARPAPVAPWSAMSNALDTATRFPSSRLRRSPHPRCLCAASAAVTQAAKRCRQWYKRGYGEVGSLCASGSGSSSRATVVRNANARSPLHKAIKRASRAVTLDAVRGSPAQSLSGNDGRWLHALHEDPALVITELAGRGRATSPAKRPMRNAAMRRARFVVPLPPSPAAPTQTTPAKLSWSVLQAPALTRPCGGASAPGQPRSGFRGVELRSTCRNL